MTLVATVRDTLVGAATFWRRTVTNGGIRLTLDGASPRLRTALQLGYELEDARLCSRFLTPGDRVLELGAAIGFVALHCIRNIRIADYAMVEANPAMADRIAENFALNDAGAPMLTIAAAGAEDGEATFHIHGDYWSSSLIERPGAGAAITVPKRTIPTLVAGLPFVPNVLIMDIEGGEADIPLDHLTAFETIVVEFHARIVGQPAIDAIVAGLAERGYAIVGRDRRSVCFRRGDRP